MQIGKQFPMNVRALRLIEAVFPMMLYIRAGREGEFPLNLYACKEMMPYFFAAVHVNYARCGLCYLLTMSRLPSGILDNFKKGKHALRHQQGIWNGIWSGMMIETSYMKFGKGPSSVIGKTTKPRIVQIWAKSPHSCGGVLKEFAMIRDKDNGHMNIHKEEGNARIKNDEIESPLNFP